MAIFFNVVESSGNYIFEQGTPPRIFRARVISYAKGAYMVLIKGVLIYTSKRNHLIGN
jgi:hypothetical protein